MKHSYLSLSPLVAWKEHPRPLDWDAVFGQDGPLYLELGCGNAEMLIRQAQEDPAARLVGLDLDWPSLRRGLRRISQARVSNIRLLLIEASNALERLFTPNSLAGITCHFPCPWPKDKHAHRRLFGQDFLCLMNSRLAPDAAFHLLTDWLPFLEWILAESPGSGLTPAWATLPAAGVTKYGRKWQATGQTEFYELTLTKQQALTRPPLQEPAMQIHRLIHADPARLTPFEFTEPDVVSCREMVYDQPAQKALARVFTVENGFRQRFYVEICREKDGPWQVKPATGSSVVPSRAVQTALEEIAKRVAVEGGEEG
ncbi:MAG: hypothetical protein KQJ78_05780 [Deltaproteobacteria bacterium]|nr:hypothetical protein [Deltaproteobacteria bacterium]